METTEFPNNLEFTYLKVWYTNADFITNKLDKFKLHIAELDPDIIAVVDTGLKTTSDDTYYFPDEILNINTYTMYRKDNIEKKGGILMYIKDTINVSPPKCKYINNISSEFKECILLELEVNNHRVLCGSIYRKPSSKANNDRLLRELIDSIAKKYNKVLLLGDFNYPKIDWKNSVVNSTPFSQEMQFYNCLENNFLTQHIKDFTRYRGTDKPSLLDLIITENTQSQVADSVNIRAPLGKSDHCILTCDYLVSTDSPKDVELPPPRRNYYKGDYEKLKTLAKETDWDHVLQDNNSHITIDQMTVNFYDKMNDLINQSIPLCSATSPKTKKEPWMKKSALKQIKKKYHSWKRYTESGKYRMYQIYTKERDKANKEVRKVKAEYEKKIAMECKKNPKAFFRYCNSKSSTKSNIIRLKDKDGNIIMSNEENANRLNNFFSSVFTQEHDSPELIFNSAHKQIFNEELDDPFTTNFQHCDDMPAIKFTEDEVYNILKTLDPYKSFIDTCVHPMVLKELAEELTYPITKLFQLSIAQGQLPSLWKEAVVSPIYKDNDRHSEKNYRPISITSTLCRCLEKIIKSNILTHLVQQECLSNHQHGFTKHKSCMTNLLETMEDITALYDQGLAVDEVFLDFAKAFDKVPHQRLIYKLNKYGISNETLCWIESFLNNRSQRVKIGKTLSNKKKVLSGVPQGSVLGPILFLLFINDLPDGIDSYVKLFADDSKIYRHIKSEHDPEIIQGDLNSLMEWCSTWGMIFNKSKCHVLHYGKHNPCSVYHLNGYIITAEDHQRDLGVSISNTLNPRQHIQNCVEKANKKLAMIKRTFTLKTKETIIPAYKALVRPLLEYCQEIWAPWLQTDINAIEKVQERALKLIPSLDSLTYEEKLNELDLFKLSERRKRGDLISMYKIMQRLYSVNSGIFPVKECRYSQRTNDRKVMITKAKTDIRKFFYSQRVAIPWNTLPKKIADSPNVDEFKRNYDHYVKNQCLN